ncbi:MAG: helix-turn-helix domain-containing protein [Actinobacteria bacterium]|nr:MAG: helix-turn-helix domain-containing protein [Actinomycetota bacterium]
MAAKTRSVDRDPVQQSGRRVRALREARGLSLRDLADLSGVSAPMLSQVERGDTSPTLAVAGKIAAGLGLSLSQLLRLDEGHHVVLARAKERRSVRRNGHRYEQVTPGLPGERASVTVHALRAGARTGGAGDAPLHAAGSRETVLVQAGALAVFVDGERFELGAGDAITFDADLPHHFENPGNTETTFTAVVTAGLRNT